MKTKVTQVQWRLGSMEEVVALSQQVPEFDQPYGLGVYQQRLAGVAHRILIAQLGDQAIGFNVSYARSAQELYVWMVGTLPEFRTLGSTQRLLDQQMQWGRAHGYQRLSVKSRNRYPAMLHLLLSNGFHIIDCEAKGDTSLDHRIHFSKPITHAE
ncbi:GNAT family N-acetyltransferase [Ferrimonas pelagia]|uniref:GNAT family N-acetyltransferase n=1 Tax=Ferrimonas pelagia TaxID=1177826 RepID=A0ABP9EHN1_9GAMM